MAKKVDKTYQIIFQNMEDQAFIKRLLEIYGYIESEPGVFFDESALRQKAKTASSKLKTTAPVKEVTLPKDNAVVKSEKGAAKTSAKKAQSPKPKKKA